MTAGFITSMDIVIVPLLLIIMKRKVSRKIWISVAMTCMGQKYTPPALAAIIMSMESVFAALCGGIFLHEVMTGREILGCVIMFAAFLLSQLADKKIPLESHEKGELT